MNTQSPNNEYLLLFRGTHWDHDLSADDIQEVMSQWRDWFENLTSQGKLKGGKPLANQGKIVSGKKGSAVADGPFAESKEAIAGFFLLEVDNLEEALKIAKGCPALEYGMKVEVRPVLESCQPNQHAIEQLAQATA